MTKPILYSFRRCPYAIRARMALSYAGIQCELRELILKDKPQNMLQHSPKGTVPVLVTGEGMVIDESLQVMQWALGQNDPNNWLRNSNASEILIQQNDHNFKPLLDRYKYADRHPELSERQHRELTLPFIESLNEALKQHQFVLSDRICLADIALFPFVRQYAYVDINWFDQLPYEKLQNWLAYLLDSPLFTQVMEKYKLYNQGFSYAFPLPK